MTRTYEAGYEIGYAEATDDRSLTVDELRAEIRSIDRLRGAYVRAADEWDGAYVAGLYEGRRDGYDFLIDVATIYELT